MTLAKVSAGQPLRIRADTWNAVIEATSTIQAERFGQGTGPAERAPTLGEILVRNDTGAARGRFDVIGLGNPLILPSVNLAGFQSRMAMRGIPSDVSRPGVFAVLQEPLAAGRIGRALASGVTTVRLQVNAVTDTAAEVTTGSSILTSAAAGSALILWVEPGTGVRHAVVRLLGPSAGGGSGDRLEIPVAQATHGFQVGHVVTTDPVSARWVRADAVTGHRARALGVVTAVADAGHCTVVLAGRVSGFAPSLYPLEPWTTYYLQAGTSGWVTADPGVAQIPVFTTTATTTEILVGTTAAAYRPAANRRVRQASHGFTVGTVIGGNGGGLQFVKAIANPGSTSWATPIGVVSAVIDVNTFEFVSHGIIAMSGLIDYTPYFLSDSVAGQLVATPPPATIPIGFCMGQSYLYVQILPAVRSLAVGDPYRNGVLRVRGSGPAGDAVVIDASVVTSAARALRLREVDVCSGGVAKKMLILASDPY